MKPDCSAYLINEIISVIIALPLIPTKIFHHLQLEIQRTKLFENVSAWGQNFGFYATSKYTGLDFNSYYINVVFLLFSEKLSLLTNIYIFFAVNFSYFPVVKLKIVKP